MVWCLQILLLCNPVASFSGVGVAQSPHFATCCSWQAENETLKAVVLMDTLQLATEALRELLGQLPSAAAVDGTSPGYLCVCMCVCALVSSIVAS